MGGKASKKTKLIEWPTSTDYDSDEIVEICETEELELEASSGVLLESCEKNQGHKEFHAISSVQLDDLPLGIRSQGMLDYFLAQEKLVVRILVRLSSTLQGASSGKENHFRKATGYAWCTDDSDPYPCPITNCDKVKGPHNCYGKILIYTNHHVIENELQAKGATVEFFFNSDKEVENKEVVEEHGFLVRELSNNKDLVGLMISVHDDGFYDRVASLKNETARTWQKVPELYQQELKNHAIVISHPHGAFKQITFGKLLALEEDEKYKPNTQNNNGATVSGVKITKYDAATCCGSSGAPVLTGHYHERPFTHSARDTKELVNISKSY